MDIIQILIQSNSLNFIVVLLVVIFILKKMNIKQKFEDIKNQITNYVNESEKEKEISEKGLLEIKNKVEKLPAEIDLIERSVQRSINNFEKKSEKEIQEKCKDIDNTAKRLLNLETKKFKSKLTGILSETSVNLAEDNAINQLKNNRELHDKYIYEAINELDGINL